MAYTLKSKRFAYDNIAAGSAAGLERHNLAAGVGDFTTKESAETLGVSADLTNSSFIANRPIVLPVAPGTFVSDSNFHGAVGPVDTDLTPTSATSPGYTSTTSFTSAIAELNTAI